MKAAVVVALVVASLVAVSAQSFTDTSPIQFYAWLASADTASAPTSARGLCAARIDAAYNFEIVCHHNITHDPVSLAHIHGPTDAPATATVNPLQQLNVGPETGTIYWSGLLTKAQACNIYATQTYVNIHTAGSPNGLLRGVLSPVGGAGSPSHAATLNNAQITGVPALGNWGVALITRVGHNLVTSLFHNLTATAQHYHEDPVGLSGSPVYWICGAGGPSPFPVCLSSAGYTINEYVNETLATTVADSGNLYINVHTAAYGNGQIRGQVQKVVAMATPSACSFAFGVKASFGLVALLAMISALLQ